MERSEKASYHAGVAKGQAQEKTHQMLDNVQEKAEAAKEYVTEAGQQMKAKAQGAADAIKVSTGTNK